jgi:hypothetical protein
MPLIKGKSEKAFKHNIEAEMHAGKPQNQSLAIAYSMKSKAQHKAEGGEMHCAHGGPDHCMSGCYADGGEVKSAMHGEQPGDGELDMVGRIMKHREHMYSKGGEVANDTPPEADFESNDFDDLALRDGLEEHYTGANSGDELGDEQEDHDREDIVARVMRSRAKKDRLPNPR